MKKEEPALSTDKIRNCLKIAVDLGYISEQQRKSLETLFNLTYQEQITEKRNKLPIWKRFSDDLSNLFRSYNIFISTGHYFKGDVVFVDNVKENWHIPFESVINADNIKNWYNIVRRQRKAVKMIAQGEMTKEEIEKLMQDAQIGRGIFKGK